MNPPAPLDPPPPRPRRRWLRVSLRGLMVLVLIIGGVAGWVAHTIRTQRQAIATVRDAGGTIRFDYQQQPVGINKGRPTFRTEPAAPAWARRWLGDELFQEVATVSFRKPITPEVLAAVGRFAGLESFTLDEATGAGDGFRHLQGLGRLERVWVAGPGITDGMLGDIAQVAATRTLLVGRPAVATADGRDITSPATDAGFARLAALPHLESLTIANCPDLTDEGAALLVAGLPPLQRFVLGGVTRASGARLTLEALAAHHPRLEFLGLNYHTSVGDADLRAVAGLRNLTGLHLPGTRITEAGLVHLRPLTGLTNLILSNTGVTDAGLATLEPLTSLQILLLTATKVTDAGMPTLARFHDLEQLSLDQLPGLTDAGLVPLHALTKLKHLAVAGSSTTPQGIAALQQAVPTLTRVATRAPRPVPPPRPAKTPSP